MLAIIKRFVVWGLWAGFLAGCSASAPAPSAANAAPVEANTIIIDNFTFNPPTLTVDAGTTVSWVNRDDVPHTVTSSNEPRTLNSPVLDTDGRYSVTFSTPGTYPYYCTVHPHMTATVVVK